MANIPWGKNNFSFTGGGGTAQAGQFANTYSFSLGAGNTSISTGTGSNTLKLGNGISSSNLIYSANAAGDLTLRVAGTSDSIQIAHDLSTSNGNTTSAIPSVTFSNGGILSIGKSTTFTQTIAKAASGTGVVWGNNDFVFSAGGGSATGGTTGSNIFEFTNGNNLVSIIPTSQATVKLEGNINKQNIWLDHIGNDLLITAMNGLQDQITIKDYYSSTSLQSIWSADGYKLDSRIGSLQTAMANYESSHPGFSAMGKTGMPSDTTLQNALNTAWHP